MEINPRHLVPFIAPLLIGYLTYSLVWAKATPFQLVQSSSIAAFRRNTPPDIGSQYRISGDPFFRNELAFEDTAFSGGNETGGNEANFGDDTKLSDFNIARAVNDIQLDGTVVVGDFRMALINGEHLHEGDDYKGYRVDRVGPTSVTVSHDDWSWELELEPLYARGETNAVRFSETGNDETASADRETVAEGNLPAAVGGARSDEVDNSVNDGTEPPAVQGKAIPTEGSDEY